MPMVTPLICDYRPLDSSALSTVDLFKASTLGRLATESLILEANLTPKPGLVDMRGSGAHRDLSLELMHRSATALEPYFIKIAARAGGCIADLSLYDDLVLLGRVAEQVMLDATGGINTHRGAIWSLGLLVAGASMQTVAEFGFSDVVATARSIAMYHQDHPSPVPSHGLLMREKFGVSGALGQAREAFPHITGVGLPALRQRRADGVEETVARLDCLLSIMSCLDDTCLLYRGGKQALEIAQGGAREILGLGGAGTESGRHRMYELDEDLVRMNSSPGGSADLLAATLFIDAVEQINFELLPTKEYSNGTA